MSAPDLDAKIATLREALRAGDDTSVAALLQSIEHDLAPMNPLMRGTTYAHVQSVLGRPAKAAAVLEDLLALMPESGMIHYQLGCYRRAAGDPTALEAFTQATALDPSLTDAWIERGTLLDTQGHPHQAVESYRHAILRAPTQVDAWRNLGNALAAIPHLDQALEAYRTASQLHPEDDTIAFLIASTYQAKGDLEAANAHLPPTLQATLGPIQELKIQAQGATLLCRFHALPDQLPHHTQAAQTLLHAAAKATTAPSFPHPLPNSYLVHHPPHHILCDPDPITPKTPHRFLDATRLIEQSP